MEGFWYMVHKTQYSECFILTLVLYATTGPEPKNGSVCIETLYSILGYRRRNIQANIAVARLEASLLGYFTPVFIYYASN